MFPSLMPPRVLLRGSAAKTLAAAFVQATARRGGRSLAVRSSCSRGGEGEVTSHEVGGVLSLGSVGRRRFSPEQADLSPIKTGAVPIGTWSGMHGWLQQYSCLVTRSRRQPKQNLPPNNFPGRPPHASNKDRVALLTRHQTSFICSDRAFWTPLHHG
jgi:hypothetical protein